jgi:dipeptidyl aminopeptidase/acylaminoacyl peptidase
MLKLVLFILFLASSVDCKTLEDTAESYFKSSEYQRMVMSPSGDFLAAETYYDAQEHIEIIDIGKKKSYVIFNGTNGISISISDIQWIDENSLIVQLKKLKSKSGFSIFKVIHLDFASGVSVESSFEFEKRGYVVDNLPSYENRVFFAHLIYSKKNTSGVYRLNLKDAKSTAAGLHFSKKIVSQITKPFYWLTDTHKNIRMILSEDDKLVHYWVLKNSNWVKTATVNEDSDSFVYPLAINSKNQLIVIKRLKNKDRKGVYLLNNSTLTVEKELFYSNDFDVTSIEVGPEDSSLIAISYIEDGVLRERVMEKHLLKSQQILKKKHPEFDQIYITSNHDFSKHLFLLHNFENEGIYVSVNLTRNETKKIIEKASWRKSLVKGHMEVIKYVNDEDVVIESYLSLPKNGQVKALLVMPHGGPIGARSYGYFDSMSHFLASYGIAVLKINYRGSSGFGNKFQELGKKQWGNKIEKDINDVVSFVVDKYKFPHDKICSAGTSYGGYSALMLHINYPQRYKCVISVAGPTDLPLMFTSSDWNINKDSIKKMVEIVGDPLKDIEKLKTQSPLYNAKKINAPVLLMHGTEDPRVNIEHSIRLEYILKRLNKPVKFLKIKGAKHGFHLLKNQVLQATELIRFINKVLNLQIKLSADEKTNL